MISEFRIPAVFCALAPALLLACAAFLATSANDKANAAEPAAAGTMLAHNVFFTLKDPTPEHQQKLVAACKKYLSDHPGTVFFAAGTLSDLNRPVNDRDFHVGLHIIFKDRASQDAYQVAELHEKFIAENKELWEKVRVFDTDVEGGAKSALAVSK